MDTHIRPILQTLADAHEHATRNVIKTVRSHYPPGTVIDVVLHGREVTITAEVLDTDTTTTSPFALRVRNLKTDKARWISVHPKYGHKVTTVSVPENEVHD